MATRKQLIQMLLLAVEDMDDVQVECFVLGAQQVASKRSATKKIKIKKPSLRLIIGGGTLGVGSADGPRSHTRSHI